MDPGGQLKGTLVRRHLRTWAQSLKGQHAATVGLPPPQQEADAEAKL